MFLIYALRSVKYILFLLLIFMFSSLLWHIEVGFETASKRAPRDEYSLSPETSNMSVFDSLINSNVCVENNSSMLAVMVVMSRAGNLDRRNMIREAYPAEELNKLGIRRLFVLATMVEDMDEFTQDWELEEEGYKYSDILLINITESYYHLGYKTLMGLKYAAFYCSGASFVIKTDDSVAYDVYQLIDLLKAIPREFRGSIFGTKAEYVLKGAGTLALEDDSNVSNVPYPNDEYLAYVSSLLYFMSTRTARVLVETSSLVPYSKNEDVFVTGVVAQEAGVPREDIGDKLSYGASLNCCRNNEKNIVYKCVFLAAYLDVLKLGNITSHSEYCFKSKNCTRLSGMETTANLECF